MRLSAVHVPTAASKFDGLDERTLADLRIYRGDFPAIAAGTYVREGGAHDVALKVEKTDQRVLPYY